MLENEYGRPAAGAPRLSGPRPSYPGELERNCAAFSGKGESVLATPNPVLRLHELSSADPHRIRVLGHSLHRRHITAARIKVGQYLIRAHGGNVVFFGRFIALLRILAGVDSTQWRTFRLASAEGAVPLAAAFRIGGFFFGKVLLQLHHAVATGVLIVALVTFFAVGYLIHRYQSISLMTWRQFSR